VDGGAANTRDTGAVTCQVEGKEYKDGQKIYPESEPCRICVCNAQFTDIYGDQCREIECGMDYRYLEGGSIKLLLFGLP